MGGLSSVSGLVLADRHPMHCGALDGRRRVSEHCPVQSDSRTPSPEREAPFRPGIERYPPGGRRTARNAFRWARRGRCVRKDSPQAVTGTHGLEGGAQHFPDVHGEAGTPDSEGSKRSRGVRSRRKAGPVAGKMERVAGRGPERTRHQRGCRGRAVSARPAPAGHGFRERPPRGGAAPRCRTISARPQRPGRHDADCRTNPRPGGPDARPSRRSVWR